MKVSTRGRYAVLALLDLAHWQIDKPVMLGKIAKRQNIPEQYLNQIFGALRKAALVTSVRGAGGGFQLARRPEQITLAQVLEATEGPLELVPGLLVKAKDRERQRECKARGIWERINGEFQQVLEKITLRDMMQIEAEHTLWGEWTYQI